MVAVEMILQDLEQALRTLYTPFVKGFLKEIRMSGGVTDKFIQKTVDNVVEHLEESHSFSFRTAPSTAVIEEALDFAVEKYESSNEIKYSASEIYRAKREIQRDVKKWKREYGAFKDEFLFLSKLRLKRFLKSVETNVDELDSILKSQNMSVAESVSLGETRSRLLRSEKKWFEGYIRERLFVEPNLPENFNFRDQDFYQILQDYMIESYCVGFKEATGKRIGYWWGRFEKVFHNVTYFLGEKDKSLKRPEQFKQYLKERENLVREYDVALNDLIYKKHKFDLAYESTDSLKCLNEIVSLKYHHKVRLKVMETKLVEDLLYEQLYGADNGDNLEKQVVGKLVKDTLGMMQAG